MHIQDNPYLQYFCGYARYDDSKLPLDPSLMVCFRKCLTPEMLGEINDRQLSYPKCDLESVDAKLALGKQLTGRQAERLDTLRKIYEQQKYMYDNKVHSVPDRIVSVSQPLIRPIVQGKAGKPVEIGAKLDISIVDGWTRLEYCSFDAYNEAGNLQKIAERFYEQEGHYL